MSTEKQLAELHELLQAIAEKAHHQQELIDDLNAQIARYNLKFFPDKQPIPFQRKNPPSEQSKTA